MINKIKSPCVWVTRPHAQSENLLEQVKQCGFKAFSFPVIAIEPIVLTPGTQDFFKHIDDYDYLIFISRNAVDHSLIKFIPPEKISSKTVLIAIGNVTASTLQQHQLNPLINKGGSFDSENLLTLPELQEHTISGKRMLLIRGRGGRELLYNSLIERGALVDVAEVYRREIPDYDEQYLNSIWRDNLPDVIIVTSNEGVDNLIALTPDEHKATLYQVPLVVMSERNAAYARECGFRRDIEVATSTVDAGLISVLPRLVETSQT